MHVLLMVSPLGFLWVGFFFPLWLVEARLVTILGENMVFCILILWVCIKRRIALVTQ